MICFFDIDGTLVGFGKMELLPSTQTALAAAKQAGHQLFICTGRSVMQVPGWLKTDTFDGIVASAGANVYYHGKEIFLQPIAEDIVRRSADLFLEHRIPFVLQGKKYNYIAKSMYREIIEALAAKGSFSVAAVEKLFGDCVQTGDTPTSEVAAEGDAVLSMMYERAIFDHETMREKLGPALKVNPSSFNKPDPYSGEITQAGITKATGIQTVMDYLGLPREETAAFGDGYNDIEMLTFAGTGVAMGDAPDAVKASADIVAEPLEADGLYLAMQKMNLLGA